MRNVRNVHLRMSASLVADRLRRWLGDALVG